MWTLFMSCREAREFCAFYLKMLVLMIFIFHNLIVQNKCHELGQGKGSFCKSDDDCDQSRFLECVANECNCRLWKSWVPEEGSCMIEPDAPCGRDIDGDGPKCITNSSCIAGKCDCDDGFLWNGMDRCELSYGRVCSKSERCAIRYLLECTESNNKNKECRCRNDGIEYVWDEARQNCVSTAGGSCDLPESDVYEKPDRLECIENAECVGNGVCQCKPGFSQTPELTCMLQYGEMCDSSTGLICNRHQLLVCREGTCDCMLYGQMKYDTQAQQCRMLAGESCGIANEGQNNRYDNDTNKLALKCVADSICEPRHGLHNGVCTCEPGMVRQRDRTCSRYNKGHGLPCSTSIDCDKEKFLECVLDENEGGRCDCIQSDMYFDGKECRVRAGKSCTKNKLCAKNSYCEGDWCVCDYGYKIGTVSCIPEGRSTSQSQINCNDAYEETEKARCHCESKSLSHLWIQEAQRCLALIGINCLTDSDCVPNAICDADEKICQCSPAAHTTKDRTCSLHSKHFSGATTRECMESHTLKSVRSQDDQSSNGVVSQGYTFYLIFLVIVVLYATEA